MQGAEYIAGDHFSELPLVNVKGKAKKNMGK
jgi:hypothetical protein